MKDRQAQIEALGKAWAALGDGRYLSTDVYGQLNETDVTHTFMRQGTDLSADLMLQGDDTDDATPCLALLRDVYGEDAEVRRDVSAYDGKRVEVWLVELQGESARHEKRLIVSPLSRVHATTLALEAKAKEGRNESE